tara:strand:+ start:703 stop:1005 length:303 start_codon:yes stop_codon:yes gene_type:complete
MATTAIKITKYGSINRLLFMTAQTEAGIDVDVSLADSDFMPLGTTSLGISPKHQDEEAYHKELRQQAHEKDQFVSDYSTNPEWNPNYVESTEEAAEDGII